MNPKKLFIPAAVLTLLLTGGCVALTDSTGGSESSRQLEEIETTAALAETETASQSTASDSPDETTAQGLPNGPQTDEPLLDLSNIPEFSGEPYVVLNRNIPDFQNEEVTTESFEIYSELDALGRCGTAFANISPELMPTEERGAIGQVKPTGWQLTKYDFVDGKYLYNRCHLIGYQLAGENANKQNLITGTRYLNIEGMLPFENEVADYARETRNHVLYRVTPVFEGDNLLASGVVMEGQSVENDDILFHVYCYNAQPGVQIDYATGESRALENAETTVPQTESTGQTTTTAPQSTERTTTTSAITESPGTQSEEATYIINHNSGIFHRPDCSSVEKIKPKYREEVTCPREELIEQGYAACKLCKP